ncbi:MAG: Gfo/Idh/MocA family oxidoreductase [Thermomicrobiales bacterium]
MTRKRVVIVGLDHYHTSGWVESLGLFTDRLEIVGLYEPDLTLKSSLRPRFQDPHFPESLPTTYRSLPFLDDLQTLITTCEPDIALVTLPNRDTPAALTTLAQAGIHILTDKPGARTADDLQHAVDVARHNNVKIATGLIRRYGRPWQRARQLVDEGSIGRLLSTESVFNTSTPWIRDPANHIFSNELQGGGILMWLGVHDLDQLLWLTGERDRRSAGDVRSGKQRRDRCRGCDLRVAPLYRWRRGNLPLRLCAAAHHVGGVSGNSRRGER